MWFLGYLMQILCNCQFFSLLYIVVLMLNDILFDIFSTEYNSIIPDNYLLFHKVIGSILYP